MGGGDESHEVYSGQMFLTNESDWRSKNMKAEVRRRKNKFSNSFYD